MAENMYALTFNIQPDCFVNRKKWKLYTMSKQICLLTSILNERCLRFCMQIDWSHYSVERCPNLMNMHIHTIVRKPDNIMDMNQHLSKSINDEYSYEGFNACYITPITDINGWYDYIRKCHSE